MTDSYVQLQPDGSGKAIDTQTVVTPTGTTVHRQTVTIGDGVDVADIATVGGGALNVNDATGSLLGATTSDKPFFTAITGDPSGDFAGVNLLEQAMTDGSGLAVNVKTLNAPAVDANNATIISDAKAIQTPTIPASASFIFDTTGYQSFNVTTQALSANVTASNDGITWSALTGTPLILGTLTSTLAAGTAYSFPCIARFVKLASVSAGTATIYLRAAPWVAAYTNSPLAQNVGQVSGTNVVTPGFSGGMSVGGNLAAGVTPTSFPVLVGGVDNNTTPLTRRLQTDTNGNLSSVGPLPIGAQVGSYNSAILTKAQSTVNPVLIAGIDQGDVVRGILTDITGSLIVTPEPSTPANVGVAELLTQILAIQRVQALYLYQLVQAAVPGVSDEPEDLAAEFLNPAVDNSLPYLKN